MMFSIRWIAHRFTNEEEINQIVNVIFDRLGAE